MNETMADTPAYNRWEGMASREKDISAHLVTVEIVRRALPELDPDSHKGRNGKILVVGGSPLFHGAGRLAAMAAHETLLSVASRVSDMVFFCSTEDNVSFLKDRLETFIGITRDQFNTYLSRTDVILVGPGLMREEDVGRPDTKGEPELTRAVTRATLESGKKAVLDAGSLQVVAAEELRNKAKAIITPHRTEMKNLFGGDEGSYFVSQKANFEEVAAVGKRVLANAESYGITILLKGPIDIIAGENGWFFSPGGTPAMTKGGTGDVLAGVVSALYTRIDDPLLAAAAGSFVLKRAGEDLEETPDVREFFNASDLTRQITKTLAGLRSTT